MNGTAKDAKGFVEGVVRYLRASSAADKSSQFPKVQTLLYKISSSARKERIARVDSPIELTVPEKQKLETLLSKIVGHSLVFEYSTNSSLLAGLRIRMGDWVFDTSLVTQVDELAVMLRNTPL